MSEVVHENDALDRFETIWEHVECGIAIVDAETREIMDVNPVAARMFGADKAQIVGRRCHKFICPAEMRSCPIMDKNQTVDRSERRFIRANGEVIPIIKSVAKIRYNGRLALLESFTDISPLKEAEAKLVTLHATEQANRAKSDFLSRMSHEMRTPMNAIIGMAKIADTTSDTEKLKYCLSMIGVSSTHLLGLINDVLDMSKIEAGKFELSHAPLNIEQMLGRICQLVIEKAAQKNLTFRVSLGEEMNLDYIGDELRLSQVVTNIISNAIKFTPEGGSIRLSVDEVRKEEGLTILRFTIMDTGIGMSAEQIGKLFQAFEQTDHSISQRFGGTGLGLAISKSIVEKMGGSIQVVSEVGKGSSFTFEVKLEPSSEPSIQPKKLPALRILLAAADAEDRREFVSMSKRFGWRVDEAETGRDALALVQTAASTKPYDAIFLTANLSDMSGADVLRHMGPTLDRETVIWLVSFTEWGAMEASSASSDTRRFVVKPFLPGSLRQTVQNLHQATPQSSPALSPAATPDFSSVTILLAEDVAINREIMVALLEPTRLRIEMAENGRLAVEKFTQDPERYDLIIMDVQMPEMNGYEATKTIRSLSIPRASTIPIVAMTANVFREDIEKCLASGMNDHLAKPIDEQAVISKIQHYRRP